MAFSLCPRFVQHPGRRTPSSPRLRQVRPGFKAPRQFRFVPPFVLQPLTQILIAECLSLRGMLYAIRTDSTSSEMQLWPPGTQTPPVREDNPIPSGALQARPEQCWEAASAFTGIKEVLSTSDLQGDRRPWVGMVSSKRYYPS